MAKKQQIVRRITDGDEEFIVVKPDFIENLAAELEEVKRDRDAAMNDIAHICHTCNKKRCIGCKQCSNWVWRGPCAENGGAE